MDSEHWLVKFKICCCMTNDDFNWQILHENNLLFARQYFVRLQKTLTAFKAICYIKSLIKQLRYQISNTKWKDMEPNEERQGNDKKAERPAKGRERNDNVCSRRLLRKEKLAWESVNEKHGKKRLLKRKVSKGLSSQRYVPMIL